MNILPLRAKPFFLWLVRHTTYPDTGYGKFGNNGMRRDKNPLRILSLQRWLKNSTISNITEGDPSAKPQDDKTWRSVFATALFLRITHYLMFIFKQKRDNQDHGPRCLFTTNVVCLNACLFLFCKLVFANAAFRAFPIIRQILKQSAGRNALVRITHCLVINIAANFTTPFCHFYTPILF